MSRYTIPLVNGTYVFPISVADVGKMYHQILLDFTTEPSAGTLKVEFRSTDDQTWRVVNEARALLLLNSSAAVFFGFVVEFRMTISDVSGGSGMVAVIQSSDSWIGPGLPDGVFDGTRAVFERPISEGNVLRGVQYYVREAWPKANQIPAGETRKLYFLLGSEKVQVLHRDFHFFAEELRIQLFVSPVTVTGGTDVTVHNYNNDTPVATSLMAVKRDVSTVSDGTQFGGDEYFFGSATGGQRNGDTIPEGFLRALPAGGSFIVAITNTGSGASSAQYYLTWTEGEPDIPRRGDGA